MSVDPAWEIAHQKKTWGAWPKEEVVRWTMKTWGHLDYNERVQVRMLDVGCGAGAHSLFLAREGFSVTALDGSATALQRLWSRLAKENPRACGRVDLLQDDAQRMSIEGASVDGAIDVCCLCHCKDPREAAAEIARVLRPGGRLISVLPTIDCHRGPFERMGTAHFFKFDEMFPLFSGFSVVSVGQTTHKPPGSVDSATNDLWVVDCIK